MGLRDAEEMLESAKGVIAQLEREHAELTRTRTVDRVGLRNWLWGVIGREPAAATVDEVVRRYLRVDAGIVLSPDQAARVLGWYRDGDHMEAGDEDHALAMHLAEWIAEGVE